jgi:septal ring factor EnvC (AmiA/AmiB activator)
LAGFEVADGVVTAHCEFDFCAPTHSNGISFPLEVLLASDKIGEFQHLTSSHQNELRGNSILAEKATCERQTEIEVLYKTNSQIECTNAEMHKAIDRLSASHADLQSEVPRLKADLSENESQIEQLMLSQKKLVKENSDMDLLHREKWYLFAQLEEA